MTAKLLIVGSKRPEIFEDSYARAFRKFSWDVFFWDPIPTLHYVARGGKLGAFLSSFVHVEPWLNKANVELLRLAKKINPDLILVIRTHGLRGGTLAQLKALVPKVLVYCIYPDGPHNLDADRINCLPFFDRVTTSSPAWVEAFERLGARKVHYLPFAADTEMYKPITRQSNECGDQRYDLAFIGTWRLERENILENLIDFDLKIWGGDYWRRRVRCGSPLKSKWEGRPVTGNEFVEVSSRSKIMLNIMDPISWPGPNMRVFELPACRAFAICERSQAILELFTEGETIECFETVDEIREKIKYYLAHSEEREKIATASYRFVTEQGHTYLDRAQQLIQWMKADGATI